jgi:RIO kinase 1
MRTLRRFDSSRRRDFPVAFRFKPPRMDRREYTFMNKNDYQELLHELDDLELDGVVANPSKRKLRGPERNLKTFSKVEEKFARINDTRTSLKYTYKAARFEEGWLLDSLDDFYEHAWITDVLRKVKAGKEASVYLCRGGPAAGEDLLVAKVYRPRMLRNLKNDHVYREGRVDLDENGQVVGDDNRSRAIRQRTVFGRELMHQSWIAYEYTVLQALHAATLDVPRPFEMARNAILMGYVGDLDAPAPALSDVSLDQAEAQMVFERVLHNIDQMLVHDVVHGDLSAYNILYREGAPMLIDFPQAVSPQVNRDAWRIFERDVTRVCEYFARQGVRSAPRQIAETLWRKHGHSVRREIHPRDLDADDPRDRNAWKETAG